MHRLWRVRIGVPANAIKADTEEGLEDWLKLNREYAAKWPNLTAKEVPPAHAKEGDGVPGKLAQFSPNPHEEQSGAKASPRRHRRSQWTPDQKIGSFLRGPPRWAGWHGHRSCRYELRVCRHRSDRASNFRLMAASMPNLRKRNDWKSSV